MPELPEVETVRRIMEPQLAGRTILSVRVCQPQIIAHPAPEAFERALCRQTISDVSRRGKFLRIQMESGDRLCLHLRMTGQLLVESAGAPIEKHTHLIAALSDGNELRYIDVRRFGRFWLFAKGEADDRTGIAKLGPEPTDAALTADYLKMRGQTGRPVKALLHDQTVVAGIGNIYSDEILFAAGICPKTLCRDLSDQDWARLAAKIPEVLLWATAQNEISPEDYLAGRGREYRNTPHLRVYGLSGQPCAVCGTVLQKLTVAGRSSCYCPNCQPDKGR